MTHLGFLSLSLLGDSTTLLMAMRGFLMVAAAQARARRVEVSEVDFGIIDKEIQM